MTDDPPDAARWARRAGTALLVLTVGLAYYPSLGHPPRADQWAFLVDTYDEPRFVPLVLRTYSWNRTREVFPGDYQLFRPSLFALLCGEKALFGARYACWQAFGIGLHLAVVLALLRLLLRLEAAAPDASSSVRAARVALAYAVALFFGVNFAGTEMVIWCHIHAYMLYMLLVLGGLLLVADDLLGGAPVGAWRLAGAFLLTLLAAFTYETGSAYAVLLGAALALAAWRHGRPRRAAAVACLFASVFVAYRAADWLDRRGHPGAGPDVTAATILDHAFGRATIDHAGRYALFTLWQPFYPIASSWEFEKRLVLHEPGDDWNRYTRLKAPTLLSHAAVAAAAALALWQLRRLLAGRRTGADLLLPMLLLGLFGLHMGAVVLGRMNIRPGPGVLAASSYYAYTPLALLLVGLYFFWVCRPATRSRPACAVLVALGASLVVLAAASAHKVYTLNGKMAEEMRPLANQIDCIQGAIDRHGREPGFALSFDPPLLDELNSCHGLARLEALFFPYFDHSRPTHVVCGTPGGLYVLPADEYEASRGGAYYREVPRVVGKSTHYMVYEHGGRYFATWQNLGRFTRTPGRFEDVMEGDSLEAVEREAAARIGDH
jgi:hypothetical protein